jgi:DNA-binding LacI/PurR family transcriptional regulator
VQEAQDDRGATLRDVARTAGVSPATASRALSNPEKVAPATRARVQHAAAELGYRANQAARTLATGTSGMIGLVLPDIESPFFASIAKGVDARARDTGRAVLIADTEEDANLEYDIVQRLLERVEGVILCSPRMGSAQLEAAAAAGDVVLVNREAGEIPSVSFDNAGGVRQALAHLRALGHRTIAYVGGPQTAWSDRERRAALHELPDVEIADIGHHRPVFRSGVAAADLVLASGATAVLCYNDLVALGVLRRLQDRGVRVPQDISVIGFDDIYAASLVAPALTTVSVPWARAGRNAVDLLLDAGSPKAKGPGLAVELVVRDSTAQRQAAMPAEAAQRT